MATITSRTCDVCKVEQPDGRGSFGWNHLELLGPDPWKASDIQRTDLCANCSTLVRAFLELVREKPDFAEQVKLVAAGFQSEQKTGVNA